MNTLTPHSIRRSVWTALALAAPLATQTAWAQTPPPATRDMQAVIDQLKSYQAPPIPTLTPFNARNTPPASFAAQEVAGKRRVNPFAPVGDIFHRTIPGPNGNQILVRFYKPAGVSGSSLPMTVYFHGGGFVIADLNVYDAGARAIANASGSIVASVAYRQAPEHPAPAAHEDSYFATQYLMRNARFLGADANRVAVAGESAGGNLATAVCLMAKSRGGRMPIQQTLVYPYVLNPNRYSDANLNRLFPSYARNAKAVPLDKPLGKWFWRYYTPNFRYGAPARFVEPIRASVSQLRGLPPATVITAEIDVLQSEGNLYATKLRAAGVPVRYRLYRGVTHEFFGMAAVVPQARDANAFAGAGLKAAFNN